MRRELACNAKINNFRELETRYDRYNACSSEFDCEATVHLNQRIEMGAMLSPRLLKRSRVETTTTMIDEVGDNDAVPFPIGYSNRWVACDKIAHAYMLLITELPQVTQNGSREMSAFRVKAASDSASRGLRNILAFLTQALQNLHGEIAHPSGLLNQVARHGHEPGENRNAEIQLRQLLRGVHQLLLMHNSFTAFVAKDLGSSTNPKGHVQLLADIHATSDIVLALLTMILDKVNRRIQELKRPSGSAEWLPSADPLPFPPPSPHVHLLQNSSSHPPAVAKAAQLPPPIPQPRKAGRFAKRQTRNEK